MNRLFRQDGWLWRALNTATDIIVLSTMWFLLCVPLVTAGASTTALYDAVVRCIRYKEDGPYRRFWTTFKRELKLSVPTVLLNAAIVAFFWFTADWLLSLKESFRAAAIAGAVYYVVTLIPLGTLVWVFPILSRFTFGFKDLNLTALKIAISYLPRTAVLVLMTIEAVPFMIKTIFPLFFFPAVLMLLWSLFTEPVFTKLGGGLKKPGKEDVPEEAQEAADHPDADTK